LKPQQKPDAISLLAAMQPNAAMPPEQQNRRPTPARDRKPAKTGARAGTRQIAGHFPDATLKALKHLMAEEDTTLQALLDEAIDDLLVKKGRTKLRNVYTRLAADTSTR
jgi:hypothetical protein